MYISRSTSTFLLLSIIHACSSYPDPASILDSVCSTMTPSASDHGSAPQTSVSPYTVTLSSTSYIAGSTVTVTLSGTPAFKGFMLGAKANGAWVGEFTAKPSEATSFAKCVADTANSIVVHKDGTDKATPLVFTWTAPSTVVGTVVFYYTVVQSKSTFWVSMQSEPLCEGSTACTAPTIPPPPTLVPDVKCGVDYGCVSSCGTDNCEFIVTFLTVGNVVQFSLKASARLNDDNIYMAVGFSDDSLMGTDSVVVCAMKGGVVSATNFYNNGRDSDAIAAPNEQAGLGNFAGEIVNDIFMCSFHRDLAQPNVAHYYDLNNDYYLLFVVGALESGTPIDIQQHAVPAPSVSGEIVDFQSKNHYGGSVAGLLLTKVHGCLMLIAWVFFSGIGQTVARFYKPMWPNSKWCGEKVWFTIHRTSMMMVLLCTTAAFIVIFVSVGGYSELGDQWILCHPILGIIVMGLTIANPVMAMFRCHPGTANRKFFNIFHLLVGKLAWIAGCVAIIAAFFIPKVESFVYPQTKIVMYVYLGYQFLIEVILSIVDCTVNKQTTESYEMNSVGNKGSSEAPPPPRSMIKNFLLGLHILIMTAFIAVLLAFVAGTWP